MAISRLRTVALATALMALTPISHAQDVELPCSTARLIVPWGAGGDTDTVMRLVAEALNKTGDVDVQVVNMPGQGGNLGAKEAADADPDGCTLFAIHQSAITSYFTGRIPFSHERFAPVALMARTPAVYGASAEAPFEDLNELVAYAMENPGEVLAGGTLGSTSHFVLLLLADAADIDLRYISYDGTRERMTALLAGEIQLAEINLAASKNYITSGELKSLGITSEQRFDDIPEVATAEEQGIDVVYGTDRGIVLPGETPPEVVDYWIARATEAAADPEFQERLANIGTLPLALTGDDYGQYFADTFEKWKGIAQKVGVYTPVE